MMNDVLKDRDNTNISENIKKVKARVREAAIRSGRNPDDIKIIAVSKTVEPARIIEAIDSGITDFGENWAQELRDKYDQVDRECSWHFIGHLQTNKVKYIIDKVGLLHSLDRLELAKELQKRAANIERILPVLVQVNIAEEESKFGIHANELREFLEKIKQFPNIKVKGLMTMAPFAENPQDVRWVFSDLRKLLIDIKAESVDNRDMEYLSMGMSDDFELAIEEGSNMVRIGSSIFGKR
jgi:pyridoxal phosphate enzyme (YggS family)